MRLLHVSVCPVSYLDSHTQYNKNHSSSLVSLSLLKKDIRLSDYSPAKKEGLGVSSSSKYQYFSLFFFTLSCFSFFLFLPLSLLHSVVRRGIMSTTSTSFIPFSQQAVGTLTEALQEHLVYGTVSTCSLDCGGFYPVLSRGLGGEIPIPCFYCIQAVVYEPLRACGEPQQLLDSHYQLLFLECLFFHCKYHKVRAIIIIIEQQHCCMSKLTQLKSLTIDNNDN